MFTFLAHKNQLPLFFLCTKYGPKVNIIGREYDKRVQQSFLFETKGANVKLQNGGMLGLDTSRNVSRISNPSLQQCCDGSFISVLFTFSALKEPAKELKLSFMSGEKYVNKIFLLFSGSESAEVSLN